VRLAQEPSVGHRYEWLLDEDGLALSKRPTSHDAQASGTEVSNGNLGEGQQSMLGLVQSTPRAAQLGRVGVRRNRSNGGHCCKW